MASHDTNSLLISSSSEFSYYDSFVDENLSMSPNGPLSHSLSGSSSYSSPHGSEVGSPETEESEDEVTLAELTRRMAEFAFEDDDEEEDSYIDGQSLKTANNNVFQQIPEAAGVLYASSGSGYNSPSSAYNKNHGLLNASKQPAAVLSQNLNSDNFFQMCQMRNQQQPQVRNQEPECGGRRGKNATDQKHQHNDNNNNIQNMNKKTWKSSGHGKRGNISPAVPLQGGGSGIRAVFLGGSNTNRSSKGTGVFLPSANYGSKTDPKKKTSGCSTVLIPARVLQTLQQHFNNVGAKSQSQNTDVLARINGLLSQEKEQAVFKIQAPEQAVAVVEPAPVTEQEELRLPQEWTY